MKIVLAYSGGLDTSVLLKQFVEAGHDVVAMTANLGESDLVAGDGSQAALDAVRQKALALGAKDAVLIDARERFITDFAYKALAANAQLDYARAMAFVAFDAVSHELVGVVRIHSDSIYESGEYAILLRSDLKGRGLGWALMQLMIEYARAEGLKTVAGDVLRDNTIMLDLCRQLGFEVKSDPHEHDICNVKLML